MTSLEGGPADGQKLSLRGSPFLLRVTENPSASKHRFDALDQPGDEPAEHERIHVYRLAGEPTYYHLKGSKGVSGYWPMATYTYLDEQPGDDHTRTLTAWRSWCGSQPIGDARAAKLERHLKEVVGIANPLRFVRNYCQWPVEGLAALNEDQGRELIDLATKYVTRTERQKAEEKERERKKLQGEGSVYRG